jgi:integrase
MALFHRRDKIMPRTPSIRYYTSRQAYYTQYQGHQHLLCAGPKDEPDGRTYKAAVRRFNEIMQATDLERDQDTAAVSVVIARYYHSLELEGRKNTLHLARTMLDPAIADFGHVKVRELKPLIVNDWITRMASREPRGRERPWNSSTQNTALCYLSRAFNWAKEQGILHRNPVAGIAKPERRVRGKEVAMPEALQDLLIEVAHPALGKFLRMMRGTGCRPGEAIHAEFKHYRPEVGAVVFPWNPPPGEWRWKTAKKTKRDRVIYLPPDLQTMVEGEITARGGTGRIFLTARGKHFTTTTLTNRMLALAQHPRVIDWCRANQFDARKIMAYSFRHSYITRMLKAACPIKLLADLCGTSVNMIEKTYSHAHEDLAAMRRLALQFSAAASSLPVP